MTGKSEVEGKPERPAQPQNGRDCSRGEQPNARAELQGVRVPGCRERRRQHGLASVRFLVLLSLSLSPRLSCRPWGKPASIVLARCGQYLRQLADELLAGTQRPGSRVGRNGVD